MRSFPLCGLRVRGGGREVALRWEENIIYANARQPTRQTEITNGGSIAAKTGIMLQLNNLIDIDDHDNDNNRICQMTTAAYGGVTVGNYAKKLT